MFNLQEQELVYDSVSPSTRKTSGVKCLLLDKRVLKQAHAPCNNALMTECASVKTEPMLVIFELLREGKCTLLLMAYYSVRVAFYMLELLIASAGNLLIACLTWLRRQPGWP